MELKNTAQFEEMKKYLFKELPEKERETLEDKFFEDSGYFYELVSLENDLVDSYVHGNLKGADLNRFEKSLVKSPERREKIANARAIQSLISEEKPAIVSVHVPTFGERIANFFNFKASGLQLAMGALAVLLAVCTGFLLYQNWQKNNEIAELQKNREIEINQREKDLQEKIKQSQERQQELQKQLEGERGQTEVFNEQLAAEQAEKAKLLQQLENLQKEKNKQTIPNNQNNQNNPPAPTLASVFPVFMVTTRGPEEVLIPSKATHIKFSFKLLNYTAGKTYDVKLDGANAGRNLKPHPIKSGDQVVNITIPVQKLGDSEHTINIDGTDYMFRLKKQ